MPQPIRTPDFARGLARGLTADLVGAPVDLMTTLVNGGLAGYGYLGHKLGLLKPNEMPDLIERPVGGSDWFAGKSTPLTDDGSTGFTAGRLATMALPALNKGLAKIPLQRDSKPNIFVGVTADNMDPEKLKKAQTLYSNKATPEQIWQETGWFKGKDGKWRFEIPDNAFTFVKDPDPYARTDSRLPYSQYLSKARQNSIGGLSDFVDHPKLFEAYPELRDTPVEILASKHYLGQSRGSFDPSSGEIIAKATTPDELRKIILHELQHKIQQLEGFEPGGSPTTALTTIRETAKEHPAAQAINLQQLSSLYGFPIQEAPIRYPAVKPYLADYAAETPRAKLNDTLDRFLGIKDKTSFDLYKGLAGETEARNVETRSLFSPEERLMNPPWKTADVPLDQQYLIRRSISGKALSSLDRGMTGKMEAVNAPGTLPEFPPGESPIPEGYVRLYHQTPAENVESIREKGLNIGFAKGIEGPRAIYASEKGFYGDPSSRPTVEFMVPRDKWDDPFVLQDVSPEEMTAIHLPWHDKARYILKNPGSLKKALAGEFDNLDGDYAEAVAFVKKQNSPEEGLAKLDAAGRFRPSAFSDLRIPDWKSRDRLVPMAIDDFLSLAHPGFDKRKAADVKKLLDTNTPFETIPQLYTSGREGNLKITGHEGRHRARALREAGYKTMPVTLKGDIRWSEQADPTRFDYSQTWPTGLIAEQGGLVLPFPVPREKAMADYMDLLKGLAGKK